MGLRPDMSDGSPSRYGGLRWVSDSNNNFVYLMYTMFATSQILFSTVEQFYGFTEWALASI